MVVGPKRMVKNTHTPFYSPLVDKRGGPRLWIRVTGQMYGGPSNPVIMPSHPGLN